jgi:hypothetical protein
MTAAVDAIAADVAYKANDLPDLVSSILSTRHEGAVASVTTTVGAIEAHREHSAGEAPTPAPGILSARPNPQLPVSNHRASAPALSRRALALVLLVAVPLSVWAVHEMLAVTPAIRKRRRPHSASPLVK